MIGTVAPHLLMGVLFLGWRMGWQGKNNLNKTGRNGPEPDEQVHAPGKWEQIIIVLIVPVIMIGIIMIYCKVAITTGSANAQAARIAMHSAAHPGRRSPPADPRVRPLKYLYLSADCC